MSKPKIAVLYSIDSAEADISKLSADAIHQTLKTKGYAIQQIAGSLANIKALRPTDFAMVIIAMHGGIGEDGTVQQLLEKQGLRYTGSNSAASQMALDKFATKNIFAKNKISSPDFFFITKKSYVCKKILENWLPCIIKPRFEGSSIGIKILRTSQSVFEAIDYMYFYDSDFLVEKYISGQELSVSVLQGKCLPIVEIIPKSDFFNFQAKYKKGQTSYVVPAKIKTNIARQIQADCLAIFDLFGCKDYARIDLILDSTMQPFFLEANTIPGFTETSLLPKAAQAAGLNFAELWERIIR
jgi:D-alanine-D-alanine ligase